MAFGHGDYQLRKRLAFSIETVSHPNSVQRNGVGNAERSDALVYKVQQRPVTWSYSAGVVYGLHVSLPVHASVVADSVERDQGAKEQRVFFEYVTFTQSASAGTPFGTRIPPYSKRMGKT